MHDDLAGLSEEPFAADDRTRWLGQKGLESAVLRCAASLHWSDAATSHFSVLAAVEAAMWACALDRRAQPRYAYERRRDADRDGRVMRGLRWGYESGALYLATPPRSTHPGMGQPAVARFTWPASVALRAEGRARGPGDLLGRGAYDRHLAGGPVIDTLRAAERWLTLSLNVSDVL